MGVADARLEFGGAMAPANNFPGAVARITNILPSVDDTCSKQAINSHENLFATDLIVLNPVLLPPQP